MKAAHELAEKINAAVDRIERGPHQHEVADWGKEEIKALIAEAVRPLVEAAQRKLDNDHADGDFGYLTQDGAAECCQCARSAGSIVSIEHEDGCLQVAHDRLEGELARWRQR